MTPQPSFDQPTSSELEQARSAVRQNRLDDAGTLYRKALAADPQQVEALRFLANAALARSDASEAVALLARATAVDRNDVGVLLDLGGAYNAAGRRDEARHVLRHALDVTQGRNTTARLMLAYVLEQDDRPDMALIHYFRAIIDAQGKGLWLSDETTEAGLRSIVRHALEYVGQGRRALFDAAIRPYRSPGTDALARVDAALAGYLLEAPVAFDDPRQRVGFLYVPSLGRTTTLDSAGISGLDAFAAHIGTFAASIDALVDPRDAEPPAPADAFSLAALSQDSAPPAVRSIPLCQRGNVTLPARTHATNLLVALDAIALMRVGGYGANIRVDVLPPGSRTSVEYGRSNAICRVLVACPEFTPVAAIVGGERHALEPGRAIACDQSFGVGLENTSDRPARVLSMDAWHPNLSAAEVNALSALIKAVLQFDRQLQDPDQRGS